MTTLLKYISNPKQRRAFTVIEVLLVVVLFSIAATAIFPNLTQFYAKTVLDNSVQRTVKLFQYARMRAVMENAFLRLTCDSDENTYVLEMKNENEDVRDEYIQLTGKFGKRFKLPDNVRFGARTSVAVFFNPDGSAEKYRIEIEQEGIKRVVMQGKDYFGTPQIAEEVL
ncbi:MAG: GspH/FimT family pseudopilin [Candidatus Omnitrophica bacterium]|nr:GspH/FimT family pseudopilin [Candidatus Omnitrophota bacterium]